MQVILFSDPCSPCIYEKVSFKLHHLCISELCCVCSQDRERQNAQIGNMVEFAIALIGKLDGINRHSFNTFRLRVGKSGYKTLNSTSLLITQLLLGGHFISRYFILAFTTLTFELRVKNETNICRM